MNVISKVIRTTAFKLSVIYLAAFVIFAVSIVVYIGRNSVNIITEQVEETIRTEVRVLSDQYGQGGIRGMIRTVEQRSRLPHASLFLVTDFARNFLAGNIAYLPPDVFNESEARTIHTNYLPLQVGVGNPNSPVGPEAEEAAQGYEAIVRVYGLQGGFRVVIGRDVSDTFKFLDLLGNTLILTLVGTILVALVGWIFIGRRVLNRINSITATSRTIMAGDLSMRLQVTGSGDEFDRLAVSLNAMLERIESLMTGLKEVTDNIAHDLKSPLTRLRNKMEAALRENKDVDTYKETVEAVIDEADNLIRIFNALLRIARVEAGSHEKGMEEIELSPVVQEVFELYEPVAEDEQVKLILQECQNVKIRSSRDLISQAVINLIDNALKYGQTGTEVQSEIRISLTADKSYAYLVVSDNGTGISEEDRSKVGKRFVRLEKSRNLPGSGLGLSLVQAVATMHEGEMMLGDNNPGLQIILKLPLLSKITMQKARPAPKRRLLPVLNWKKSKRGSKQDGSADSKHWDNRSNTAQNTNYNS